MMYKVRQTGSFLASFIDNVSKIAAIVASICVLTMMTVVFYEVIARYFFKSPTSWSVEMAGYLMVAAVMLGLAYASSQGKHVKVDLLISRLSKRKQLIFELFGFTLTLILFSLITWKAGEYAWLTFQQGTKSSGVMEFPLFPSKLMVPLGSFLFCLQLILLIFRRVGDLRHET